MKKTITLQVFADPGHAWARFPLARLAKLGIANQISKYSYIRGDYAYLEEDRDMGVLVEALEQRGYQFSVNVQVTNRQSKIRGYQSYPALSEIGE